MGRMDRKIRDTALKNLCKACLLGMHAILAERPDAIFIQSESTQYFHPEGTECLERAGVYNEKRFLSFDLDKKLIAPWREALPTESDVLRICA